MHLWISWQRRDGKSGTSTVHKFTICVRVIGEESPAPSRKVILGTAFEVASNGPAYKGYLPPVTFTCDGFFCKKNRAWVTHSHRWVTSAPSKIAVLSRTMPRFTSHVRPFPKRTISVVLKRPFSETHFEPIFSVVLSGSRRGVLAHNAEGEERTSAQLYH